MSVLGRLVPAWLQPYPRGVFGADLAAGFIVAVLVVPQSLAYALLAGLPPQAGLYVSIFPAIAYALLGSSRVQAVGPVAITAIMTFSVLSPLAAPGSAPYIALAAALAHVSGLMILAAGVLRLGFLAQLLSRPVMSGFISGAAVLIVISQLKGLLGIAAQGDSTWRVLADLLLRLPEAHLATLALSVPALAVLLLSRSALPRLLGRLGMAAGRAVFVARLMPLAVVAAGTLAVTALDLDRRHGVAVVGKVAAGLPGFTFFVPDAGTLSALLVPAFLMALIGMVQCITMAQALAVRRRERVDANAELIGLGAANLVAAFYGGMPVGGGVSRSAVNVAAGAHTPLAGIVAALATIALVAGGAQYLERLPLAVLAASIIVAAWSMIDLAALRRAWTYDRADAMALLGTALGVILLGIETGIGLGILLSAAALLFRASQPHIAVVGRIRGSEHFRNIERHDVETLPATLFIRIDERLFFGNLAAVEARISQELARLPGVRDLVLVMSAVNLMDATAVEVFDELNRDLGERGIRLHLAEIKGPVEDRLRRATLWQALSGEIYLSANQAFEALATQKGRPTPGAHQPR
ncbi:MAG: SulP family inorganic anion transporter [Betaproteobacteria bacterium]|nr:SulP family inorganic anion transporter [Betaproteobacteria bacterium]